MMDSGRETVICENCDGSGKVFDLITGELIDDPVCGGDGFIYAD